MSGSYEITLRGASFQDVVNQARELVNAATAFEQTTRTPKATGAGAVAARGTAAKVTLADVHELDTTGVDEDEDGQTTLDFDTITDAVATDDEEETEVVTKAAKTTTKAKAKKLSDKDVNAAAMAHAKVHGRPKTLGILQKKFKVKSILELKADQYEDAIKALSI